MVDPAYAGKAKSTEANMGLQDRDWFNERKQKPAIARKRAGKAARKPQSDTFWTGVAMAVVAAAILLYRLL
jgi:hypothetical protein